MPGTLQTYLARATAEAVDELIAALDRLPADKIQWSPQGTARTALNLVAEVALMNRDTPVLLQTRAWRADYSFDAFFGEMAALAQDRDKALALLRESTASPRRHPRCRPRRRPGNHSRHALGAYESVADIAAYPFWNMKYHLGQINYLASLLGIEL